MLGYVVRNIRDLLHAAPAITGIQGTQRNQEKVDG